MEENKEYSLEDFVNEKVDPENEKYIRSGYSTENLSINQNTDLKDREGEK